MTDAYSDRVAADRLGMAQAELRYTVVEAVAQALEETGLSQRELAVRLGLSEGAVSQVLGGDRNLTLNKIAAYADALDRRVIVKFAHCHEGVGRHLTSLSQVTGPTVGTGYAEQTQDVRAFSRTRDVA